MNLGTLKPPVGSRKKRKRIGRGNASGQGSTAGKGHKGQKARSGGKVRRGFEGGQMPMARRLPKRGFVNIFKKEIIAINVEKLTVFPVGTLVNKELLISVGLVKKSADGIKLLGKGSIENALNIELSLVSKGAHDKIVAAGGSVMQEVAQ